MLPTWHEAILKYEAEDKNKVKKELLRPAPSQIPQLRLYLAVYRPQACFYMTWKQHNPIVLTLKQTIDFWILP